MSERAVIYEMRGPSAWVTINRPEARNALNDAVIEGLLEGLQRAAADEAVRCVVLTGAGDRAFCAGADLTSTMGPGASRVEQHRRRGRIGDVLVALMRHPRPVIARVNGAALAGGFGVMLACDLVVGARGAEVGAPEINVGLWPYMISAVIARNVPRKIASELMLTGRRMPMEEAARWGMVNRVVPPAELDAAVEELASSLASKSALVLRLGKESYARAQDMALEDALAYLQSMLTVNLESEDVVEGVSAFLEKRPPSWRDR